VLAEMGRCGAPCEGRESRAAYAIHVEDARTAIDGDAGRLVERLLARIGRLADAQRFEEAAVHRDRLVTFLRCAARVQRLVGLTRCRQLVAARPTPDSGWEVVAVRHGRLIGSAAVPPGVSPRPHVDALLATAEPLALRPGPAPVADVEETETLLRWLDGPGVRLIELDGEWSSPRSGAGAYRRWVESIADDRLAREPSADRRHLRPTSQPVATHRSWLAAAGQDRYWQRWSS
jgi:DNA polymerase-3 subunit epsilon